MPKIRTDEEVEQEIARLLKSPHVHLAQKEQRDRNRRRKYLSDLLWLEKRGKEIEKEKQNEEA